MKIKLPEGFEVPDTAKPGEPFESVITLVADDSGMAEVKAIDGVEISEECCCEECMKERGEDEETEGEKKGAAVVVAKVPLGDAKATAENVKLPWDEEA